MLLDQYAEQSLLCNVSVNGVTSEANTYAYRGDMVIEEGDIADAQGRRHPPKSTLKQAVVLIADDKAKMISGVVDDIAYLPEYIEKYAESLTSDTQILFYVANISQSMKVDINGTECLLIPHDDGAVWTLLMDDLRMEKSDFKGQSAEDKVITMFDALLDFKPKFDEKSYTDALNFTIEVKKEARGPV